VPTLLEPPSPASVTFLAETRDGEGVASGWLLGDGPAQPVQMPPEGLDGWRTVYVSQKVAAGAAEGAKVAGMDQPVNPLWWLLGGTVVAGVWIAVISSMDGQYSAAAATKEASLRITAQDRAQADADWAVISADGEASIKTNFENHMDKFADKSSRRQREPTEILWSWQSSSRSPLAVRGQGALAALGIPGSEPALFHPYPPNQPTYSRCEIKLSLSA